MKAYNTTKVINNIKTELVYGEVLSEEKVKEMYSNAPRKLYPDYGTTENYDKWNGLINV